MISDIQKPVDSNFNSQSSADKIIKDVNLKKNISIITGGYSGIGLETTKALVKAGANVIIPAKRPELAIKNLEGIVSKENIISMDLGNLNSIKSFTDAFIEKHNRLDIY